MDRSPIQYSEAAGWIKENKDHAQALLSKYFEKKIDEKAKTVWHGQHFEWFANRVARDCFTEVDLAAIGALSVTLPAQTARELIEDRDQALRQLLRECNLWISQNGNDASESRVSRSWMDKDRSFWKLWNELVRPERVELGGVKASKLMAAKFPALIPVFDSRVAWLLGLTDKDPWWTMMTDLVLETKSTLDALQIDREDIHATTLRKLDVILWMEAGVRQGLVTN